MIIFSEGWKGHLWQGRFASYVLDKIHLLACARYIEMNPVRAKLIKKSNALDMEQYFHSY